MIYSDTKKKVNWRSGEKPPLGWQNAPTYLTVEE
jgi:hypothetical protein